MLTVIKESSGKYFASIICECKTSHLPKSQTEVGVDLNLGDYAVLSTGEKVEHPKWLLTAEKELKRLQRQLSRKVKGSITRSKLWLKVARLHEKIGNQRNDFQHKLSRYLIDENQVISIERLQVQNMVRNRNLAKLISDSGWSGFGRMLRYKADWYGRTVKVIDTFAPSSKKCSLCGHINKALKLSQRAWVCPNCKTVHDRDINAAVNIDQMGRDTPELTPAERTTAVVLILSMRQVASKKQEVQIPQ